MMHLKQSDGGLSGVFDMKHTFTQEVAILCIINTSLLLLIKLHIALSEFMDKNI